MPTLAFFPWLNVKDDVTVGGFKLIKYQRGQKPGGSEQVIIDSVLKPYLVTTARSIQAATLLTKEGGGMIDDISETEHGKLFTFSELVAFTTLAERRFFNNFQYTNRDAAALVIQMFKADEPGGSVVIFSRRRDGHVKALVSSGAYKILKSHHIDIAVPGIELNQSLLRALTDLQTRSEFREVYEAILSFNRGNTDSDFSPQEMEAINIVSSFERLLGCYGDAAAKRFGQVWNPAAPVPANMCRRIQPEKLSEKNIAQVWLADFIGYRNKFSHGVMDNPQNPIWTLQEHLLLGSFVFPLLVKIFLKSYRVYELSDRDKLTINMFESAVCHPNLMGPPSDENGMVYPWNELEQNAWSGALRLKIEELLEQQGVLDEDAPGSTETPAKPS